MIGIYGCKVKDEAVSHNSTLIVAICGFFVSPCLYGGQRYRSGYRRCATNRKVAGSIPDGVNGIFHRHNPSDRTMAQSV